MGYFQELLASSDAISEGIRPLLQVSRDSITRLQRTEAAIIRCLQRDSLLAERIRRLQTIPAVGKVTALTWATPLETEQQAYSAGSGGSVEVGAETES